MNYIFRNTTVENIFIGPEFEFSGYDDSFNFNINCKRYIWFYFVPIKNKVESLVSEIDSFYSNIENISKKIPASSDFLILSLSTFYNNRVVKSDNRIQLAIDNFNSKIFELSNRSSNIKIIDFSSFAMKYNNEQLINWKYYFSAKIQLNPKLYHDFKDWFWRQIAQIEFKRKKCLVLDLDNTLWGGVIGEDGVSGIQIGGEYPGNVFQFFQEEILKISRTGIILAICSKNNLNDILEVFENHPQMILRKKDFLIIKSNWEDKATNIISISKELNIGLDSIVFIDDNPSERLLIKNLLPEVVVPEFPDKQYLLPDFIKDLSDKYFSAYALTKEDEFKLQSYQENKLRQELRTSIVDFEGYIKNLEIELFIQGADEYTISRISQMTQKTNQFNLTTIRYSENEIHEIIKNNGKIFHLTVKDRFGDNGITGLIILKEEDLSVINIDTFLLSCRVLGRDIEKEFLNQILLYLKKMKYKIVKSEYIHSLKNEQTKDFFEKMNFKLVENISANKKYKLLLDEFEYTDKKLYKIKFL